MKTHLHASPSILARLAACAAATIALALPSAATDYYYNSFRNNNDTTAATGNKYYVYYDGTYSLYNSPGTWFFENTTLVNTNQAGGVHGDSTIYVDADGRVGEAVFIGVNLHVSSTRAAASSSQAVSIRNGGVVHLYSSTLVKVNTSTDTSEAVYITDKSRFYGEDIVISAIAPRVRAISLATGADSFVSLNRASLSTSGSAAGLNFAGSGIGILASTTITTTGPASPAVQFNYGLAYLSYDGGSISTTDIDSPGIWAGINNASTHVITILKDVDILAGKSGGIEVNTHLPDLIGPTPAYNSNYGAYEFSLDGCTVEGALGSVRITSSATISTGTTFAEIPTRVLLTLKDSTLVNDVSVFSRAQLDLSMRASALNGDLVATGATAITGTLAGASTITGALALSGGATLDLALDNSAVSDGLAATGSSAATLRLANSSTLGGVITLENTATLDARVDSTSGLTQDITVAPGATFTYGALNGGAARLAGFTLAGHLRLPGKTTITSPLTLAGNDALITLANVSGNDLVLAAGVTGAATLAVESIAPAAISQAEIHIVNDQTGAMAPDTFALAGSGTLDFGLATYTLENRANGAYLVGSAGSASSAAGAIFNTHALAAVDWFHALTPVHAHLATLHDPGVLGQRRALGDTGALWARAYTSVLAANSGNASLAFDETATGLAVGADTCWDFPIHSLSAGIYGASGRTARDFLNDADGFTAAVGAGLYASWLHNDGWFAAATARFDSYKHNFNTHAATAATRADYRTLAVGGSLEAGWRFTSPSRLWWVEPSVQAAFVKFNAADYTTKSDSEAGVRRVKIDGINATQCRVQARFGCNPGNSRLGFYGRLAAAGTRASGGDAHVAGIPVMNRMLDGWAGEGAIGFTFDMERHGRLCVEYEYTRASDYTRPWTLTAGWRFAW